MTPEITFSSESCIDAIIGRWRNARGNLIMILHELQNHFGYIPRKLALELSSQLDIPLARIYEVITFYNYFKLSPPGKYIISVCMGTACYLKGASKILEEVKNVIGIKEGETTADGLFHIAPVRCLGCCGLAPVLMINDKVYGKIKPEDVVSIISVYAKEGAKK